LQKAIARSENGLLYSANNQSLMYYFIALIIFCLHF
jgi:hypothetical protein